MPLPARALCSILFPVRDSTISAPRADLQVIYSYSKGKDKTMEIRRGAFAAGTRVAVVDQWVDSGGSMVRKFRAPRKTSQICRLYIIIIFALHVFVTRMACGTCS